MSRNKTSGEDVRSLRLPHTKHTKMSPFFPTTLRDDSEAPTFILHHFSRLKTAKTVKTKISQESIGENVLTSRVLSARLILFLLEYCHL